MYFQISPDSAQAYITKEWTGKDWTGEGWNGNDCNDGEWISQEWSDYQDRMIVPRDNESYLFNIKDLNRYELNVLSDLNISENAHTPESDRPWAARFHVKGNQRFGSKSEEAKTRYDGTPVGLTQKFMLRYDRFQCGVMMDKDAFEPGIGDLVKYYASWNDETFKIIAGDFHVTQGHGLALWTSPVFSETFDVASAYRKFGRGIQPSNDAAVNSSLRGAGMTSYLGNTEISLYAANTKLDAILDDSTGNALRLSDSGLHRTDGEMLKQNTVREELFGGTANHTFCFQENYEIIVGLGFYKSHYQPAFDPEPSPRIRFPLHGNSASVSSINLRFAAESTTGICELARDLKGNLAYLAGASLQSTASGRIKTDIIHFNCPPEFINPRISNVYSGSGSSGKSVTALLLRGSPRHWLLTRWRMHVEVEHRSWRGYLLPELTSRARSSMETSHRLSDCSEMTMRYRYSSSVLGHGEEEPTESVFNNRLRATYNLKLQTAVIKRFITQIEVVSSQSDARENRYGALIGIAGKAEWTGKWMAFRRAVHVLKLVSFACEDDTYIYAGESQMPDRIGSVRLSGRGIRWSYTLTCHGGKWLWFSLNTARTMRYDRGWDVSDLEIYSSLSYYIR